MAVTEQNEANTNAGKDAESSDEPQPMINEKALLAYDLQVDDQAYGVIERDANEIMQEVQGDASLDAFRVEYDKVFFAIKKVREDEKLFVQRVRESAQSYVFQKQKIAAGKRMLHEDRQTLQALMNDLKLA